MGNLFDTKRNKVIAFAIIGALVIITVALVLAFTVGARLEVTSTEPVQTTTTEKPKPLEIKFTVPKDSNMHYLEKTYEEAEDYCKKKFTNGRLPRSNSFDDWRTPDAVKKTLKDALNGISEKKTFFVGLKYKGGNVVTYEDGFLGKASEFGGETKIDEHDVLQFVMVMAGPYLMYNTHGGTRAGVLCQHN